MDDQHNQKNRVVFPSPSRTASLTRSTYETRVNLVLNLDGSGCYEINTGLGFLDHMLKQLAVHGLFDIALGAEGEPAMDSHHIVEDVALVLGGAFDRALGDRAGIVRIGSAYACMDETLARVVVDFSGRPYSVIQTQWNSPSVGGLPTSLFPHFLESFAVAAYCNLHACIFYGHDDHHQTEALFKALAHALASATRIDPRRGGSVPSTKGTLTGR